ncbi:MAG: hypothetical protein OEX76_00150 [Candidatus Bathyarchaeota archaeon]|nr:hypothetical protein [Candidatus Bathyarchaeota archaeon]MDH5531862.1 hypothetical protein [Candidatus Bathyarchaeota archaeon]MDH5712354.1 hypothetical protein [Candidatus Bathyarchaeota archaeon]
MRRLPLPLLRHNKAVSYTMSAIIITAVTVALVIATSVYAYQVLERQRGAAEFEVAKKSILAFNDALENVAWKPKSSRSVRFTIEYGNLELMPDASILNVSATVGSNEYLLNSTSTGLARYSIKNSYVNFGEGHESYILGDASLIVTEGTESLGRALIGQELGWVNITLSYRTRAMRASVIEVNGTDVNYVNVSIVKVLIGQWSTHIHTFDLKARCLDVKTSALSVDAGVENCTIRVQSGGESDSTVIPLDPGKVVFNVIVAEVEVTL